MSVGDWLWGGLLSGAAVVEVWALRNGRTGDTFSERTRSWFRVRTPLGRAVFLVLWCVFAVWFAFHIVL